MMDRWFIQSPAKYLFPNTFQGQLPRWFLVTNHLARQVKRLLLVATFLFLLDERTYDDVLKAADSRDAHEIERKINASTFWQHFCLST